MLDRHIAKLVQPGVVQVATLLAHAKVGANGLTVAGFLIGLIAAVCIAVDAYVAAGVLVLVSRLFDVLDGAVARCTFATDRGGFLDITLDFVFYASIPLAFAIANPTQNALAAATLLAAFIGTGTSFLAFAVIAARRGMASTDYPHKSFYFLGGLTEATETFVVFLAMCAYPQHFAFLAFLFAILCAITTVTRIFWGIRAFH